ncbi:hypothetical protein RvY_09194-2 [Ramazzottius varieornatus]|uniref:Uncharacterized protein n=1 Tax=Ramazzottius varieornatus TaxID=947166 RepID=A0A1D1VAZ6_RAMVA|nr:hypothetical protein RvY_09194-2 [Ramazzottius varieornatus]
MEEVTAEVTAEVMEEGTEGLMGSAIEEKKAMRRIWNVWSESASALEEAGHAVPLLLRTGSGVRPEVLIVLKNLTKDLIAPARDLHPTVTSRQRAKRWARHLSWMRWRMTMENP